MANGNNDKLFDVKYKVLLLGDTTVGKTSLQRFIAGRDFRPDIGSSIGIYINFKLKEIIRLILYRYRFC
jgi:GTPase SAR1 family protein